MRIGNSVAAGVAGALCACASLAGCTDTSVNNSACPDYAQYGSIQDVAAASDLVGQATLEVSETESSDGFQVIRAHIADVKMGDADIAGGDISIAFDERCGESVGSVLPDGYLAGDDVIIFLVGSDGDEWSLISPTQGIVVFDRAVYDSIEA